MLPRRTINEFILRIEANKELKVIVVEGLLEKSIIEQLFDTEKVDAEVYAITELHVPISQALLKEIENGHKGRIIQLSFESAARSIDRAWFVMDSDTDIMCDINHETDFCSYHDFMSIDWYPLERSKLRKIINTYSKIVLSDTILTEILEDCKFITFLRVFRDKQRLKTKLPNPKKHINDNGRLNRTDFISAFQTQAKCDKVELRTYLDTYSDLGNSDHRLCIHFKDFMGLLFPSMKRRKILKNNFSSTELRPVINAYLHTYKLTRHEYWVNHVERLRT